VTRQKNAPLRVIMGNPPYSVGQKSANDNAQNQKYDKLDARISKTYAAETKATNKNSLYNSYMKAFRWSTDRLDPNHGGIVCFVTDAGWLNNNSQEGFRKCLEREFSSIYVFNLRGDQRTSGELSRKEGGKIFGSGSRTPIAISLLVKNPASSEKKAKIHYHDIGDYLSRDQKFGIIKNFVSIGNSNMNWDVLFPNEHSDWITERNDLFKTFIPIGEKGTNNAFFISDLYCRGLETARDAWVFNSNRTLLSENIEKTVNFFNSQALEFKKEKGIKPKLEAKDFLTFDERRISWSRAFINDVERGKSKNSAPRQ
jgi:predicted helicase